MRAHTWVIDRGLRQHIYILSFFQHGARQQVSVSHLSLPTQAVSLSPSLSLSLSLVVVSLAFCRTHNGQSLMKTTVSSSRQMYGGYFAWPTLGGGAISIFQLVDTFISLSIGLTSRGTRRL